MHHVTLGTNCTEHGAPTIGDHVFIGCYTMVLGKVTIGDNAVIGAGSLVMENVPANTVYYNKRESIRYEYQP